jgi:hypothetical protein
MKAPNNQTAEVLSQLLLYKQGITRMQFLRNTGILNVTARIANLRNKYGLTIHCKKISTQNKYGRSIKYGQWILEPNERGKAIEIYKKINK